MPRTRYIKHSFFLNEELAGLSPMDRLFFIGLWVIADRNGRLEDRPQRIKATLFPYEDVDADSALHGLSKGFITRYVVNGEKYIQINNFSKHQHTHPKEPAMYPSLPKPGICPAEPGKSRVSRENTPLTITSNSNLNSNSKGLLSAAQTRVLEQRFEIFWSLYPAHRHIKKSHSKKIWIKLNPDMKLFGQILIALKAQKADWAKSDPKFTPHPTTWLNGEYWAVGAQQSQSITEDEKKAQEKKAWWAKRMGIK